MTVELSGVAGRKETKQKIGNLRLNISEVVRNGKLRDSWALQVRCLSHHFSAVTHTQNQENFATHESTDVAV